MISEGYGQPIQAEFHANRALEPIYQGPNFRHAKMNNCSVNSHTYTPRLTFSTNTSTKRHFLTSRHSLLPEEMMEVATFSLQSLPFSLGQHHGQHLPPFHVYCCLQKHPLWEAVSGWLGVAMNFSSDLRLAMPINF